jgi:hypothetical protein
VPDDWLRKTTRPVRTNRVDATAPNVARVWNYLVGGRDNFEAQEVDPASRIVYVDNDPVVSAHARALVLSRPEGVVSYLEADAREPAAIIDAAALCPGSGLLVRRPVPGGAGHRRGPPVAS